MNPLPWPVHVRDNGGGRREPWEDDMRYRGRGYTTASLVAMARAIMDDPASCQRGGLHLYVPLARRKLDELARAVADNMAEDRARRGDPVPTCGYSGRQSNRR